MHFHQKTLILCFLSSFVILQWTIYFVGNQKNIYSLQCLDRNVYTILSWLIWIKHNVDFSAIDLMTAHWDRGGNNGWSEQWPNNDNNYIIIMIKKKTK